MLVNSLKSIKPAYQLIFKDKISSLLALIPIVIGLVLYYFLGTSIYTSGVEYGQGVIDQYISNSTFGKILGFLVVSILTILLYFLVSWTFVIVLSLIASPFNDLLSARIEKQLLNEQLPDFSSSFNGAISNILGTIFNEIKKIVLIIILSIIAVVLGYIPLLTPISVFITVLLLAVGYVDYSWSRHDIEFKKCKTDIRKNLLSYTFGGGMFMILVAIPLVNVIVPSLATSYFTVLWVKNNEHSN